MINPEFKRNLWLSFSAPRMVAMPSILALIFLSIYVSEHVSGQQNIVADYIYSVSTVLFVFIVWIWGASNAGASIIDEMRNKTWDQQRMSALDPWTITWGKLFGSTAFSWYGGIICLSAIAVSGTLENKPNLAITLMTVCSVGILLHAAMITSALYSGQCGIRPAQSAGMGWSIVIAVTFKFIIDSGLNPDTTDYTSWWGMEIDRALFWLVTTLLFTACFVFAAWRAMCSALQVRTLPWAWPVFACILAIYFAGMFPEVADQPLEGLLVTGLLVSIALTYFALLSEPNSLLHWRKLGILKEKNDWRGWFEQLPVWTTTLALGFVFASLINLYLPVQPGGSSHSSPQPIHAITLELMLLRDACILLFFAFAPSSKNAAGKAVLCLIVLDFLLPYLAAAAQLTGLLYFFMPIPFSDVRAYVPWSSVPVMSLHAVVAIGLVNWRLRNSVQP